MITQRSRRLGLALAAALATVSGLLTQAPAGALPVNPPKIGMVCLNGPTFTLTATSGNIQTPDANQVFMWSYADSSGQFQYPGPVLCVTQGQSVSVTLNNALPEATSIVFPGQEDVTAFGGTPGLFTREATSGNPVTYMFTAGSPGTYLYESGTDPSKQVEMGLYGALVVRPNSDCPSVAGTDCAYDDATTRFDTSREYLLLLAEIDPDLHHAVEVGGTYNFTTLHNRYFMINGRAFPDTLQDNSSALLPAQPYGALVRIQPTTTPGAQPALIRLLNAGADNHPFHPHGNHLTQIAQDGRQIAPTEHFGETIGSGVTEDFLLRWDNIDTDSAGQPFNDDWNPVTNAFPVPPPNYLNVMFKDANTYYSGSPYLGYKGTLPTGTVTQNICGEWYFPWHSHALNEFANFDEPFGGMATLLRVDPLNGCFAYPTSTKILAGTLNSGTYARLAVDDTNYYKVNSTTTGTRTSDWYGQLSSIPAGSKNLKVTYKGNNTFVPYTQNFNTLASSGPPSSTLPAGWALSETGTGANTTYAAGTGSSGTANTYSFGTTAADRAFGGLRGTGATPLIPTIGAQFTNNTGGTITSLAISYTGEQWRLGATGSADRLDFQYSTDATSLTSGTWTNVDPLDFTSPVTTGTLGALNGNLAANRIAVSATINGSLNIQNGNTYWIRWVDFDRGGSGVADDGLAVDDFSLTPDGALPTSVHIWNWSTSTWTQLVPPPPVTVGATDVFVADNVAVPAAPSVGSWASYIGTGANKGLVRVRVLTTGGSANFVTGGNLMKLVYDAP